MPTPLNFGAAAQTALDNILQNALPVLLPAIMLLVVAITSVLLFLYLFGFRLGLGEKFKEKLRRKKEARRGKFPIAIRRRATKETGRKVDAKSPWSDPADTMAQNLYAAEIEELDSSIDMIASYKVVDDRGTRFVAERGFRASGAQDQVYSMVENNYSVAFPDKSLRGFFDSNVSNAEKLKIAYHAARVTRMKLAALAENSSEWAKQYGDGQASRPVQFVA